MRSNSDGSRTLLCIMFVLGLFVCLNFHLYAECEFMDLYSECVFMDYGYYLQW